MVRLGISLLLVSIFLTSATPVPKAYPLPEDLEKLLATFDFPKELSRNVRKGLWKHYVGKQPVKDEPPRIQLAKNPRSLLKKDPVDNGPVIHDTFQSHIVRDSSRKTEFSGTTGFATWIWEKKLRPLSRWLSGTDDNEDASERQDGVSNGKTQFSSADTKGAAYSEDRYAYSGEELSTVILQHNSAGRILESDNTTSTATTSMVGGTTISTGDNNTTTITAATVGTAVPGATVITTSTSSTTSNPIVNTLPIKYENTKDGVLNVGEGAFFAEGNVTRSLKGTWEGPVPVENLPLSTKGRYIVDRLDHRVRLRCVNWYGPHMKHLSVGGLNVQPMWLIAKIIQTSGFNCVRLTWSLELWYDSKKIANYVVPDQATALSSNPELLDMNPIHIFDETVRVLTRYRVMIFLNNHVSKAGWCCSNDDGQGLWYTNDYPEDMWVAGVRDLSIRYRDNPYVVGHDIRNEIRPANGIFPYWYSYNPVSDWAPAALRAGIELQSAVPNQLVVVSALYYGMFLCDVHKFPLQNLIPERVVYAVHAYKWYSLRYHVRTMIEIYFATFLAGLLLGWMLILTIAFASRYFPHMYCTVKCRHFLWWCCFRKRRVDEKENKSKQKANRRIPPPKEENEICCLWCRTNKLMMVTLVVSISVPVFGYIAALFGGECDIRMQILGMTWFILAAVMAGVSLLLWGWHGMQACLRSRRVRANVLDVRKAEEEQKQLRKQLSDMAYTSGDDSETSDQLRRELRKKTQQRVPWTVRMARMQYSYPGALVFSGRRRDQRSMDTTSASDTDARNKVKAKKRPKNRDGSSWESTDTDLPKTKGMVANTNGMSASQPAVDTKLIGEYLQKMAAQRRKKKNKKKQKKERRALRKQECEQSGTPFMKSSSSSDDESEDDSMLASLLRNLMAPGGAPTGETIGSPVKAVTDYSASDSKSPDKSMTPAVIPLMSRDSPAPAPSVDDNERIARQVSAVSSQHGRTGSSHRSLQGSDRPPSTGGYAPGIAGNHNILHKLDEHGGQTDRTIAQQIVQTAVLNAQSQTAQPHEQGRSAGNLRGDPPGNLRGNPSNDSTTYIVQDAGAVPEDPELKTYQDLMRVSSETKAAFGDWALADTPGTNSLVSPSARSNKSSKERRSGEHSPHVLSYRKTRSPGLKKSHSSEISHSSIRKKRSRNDSDLKRTSSRGSRRSPSSEFKKSSRDGGSSPGLSAAPLSGSLPSRANAGGMPPVYLKDGMAIDPAMPTRVNAAVAAGGVPPRVDAGGMPSTDAGGMPMEVDAGGMRIHLEGGGMPFESMPLISVRERVQQVGAGGMPIETDAGGLPVEVDVGELPFASTQKKQAISSERDHDAIRGLPHELTTIGVGLPATAAIGALGNTSLEAEPITQGLAQSSGDMGSPSGGVASPSTNSANASNPPNCLLVPTNVGSDKTLAGLKKEKQSPRSPRKGSNENRTPRNKDSKQTQNLEKESFRSVSDLESAESFQPSAAEQRTSRTVPFEGTHQMPFEGTHQMANSDSENSVHRPLGRNLGTPHSADAAAGRSNSKREDAVHRDNTQQHPTDRNEPKKSRKKKKWKAGPEYYGKREFVEDGYVRSAHPHPGYPYHHPGYPPHHHPGYPPPPYAIDPRYGPRYPADPSSPHPSGSPPLYGGSDSSCQEEPEVAAGGKGIRGMKFNINPFGQKSSKKTAEPLDSGATVSDGEAGETDPNAKPLKRTRSTERGRIVPGVFKKPLGWFQHEKKQVGGSVSSSAAAPPLKGEENSNMELSAEQINAKLDSTIPDNRSKRIGSEKPSDLAMGVSFPPGQNTVSNAARSLFSHLRPGTTGKSGEGSADGPSGSSEPDNKWLNNVHHGHSKHKKDKDPRSRSLQGNRHEDDRQEPDMAYPDCPKGMQLYPYWPYDHDVAGSPYSPPHHGYGDHNRDYNPSYFHHSYYASKYGSNYPPPHPYGRDPYGLSRTPHGFSDSTSNSAGDFEAVQIRMKQYKSAATKLYIKGEQEKFSQKSSKAEQQQDELNRSMNNRSMDEINRSENRSNATDLDIVKIHVGDRKADSAQTVFDQDRKNGENTSGERETGRDPHSGTTNPVRPDLRSAPIGNNSPSKGYTDPGVIPERDRSSRGHRPEDKTTKQKRSAKRRRKRRKLTAELETIIDFLEKQKQKTPMRVIRFRCHYCIAFVMISVVIVLILLYEFFGDYDMFREDLDRNWGFVLRQGIAPVWLNEFGTSSSLDIWWTNIIQYIEELSMDFAYWPLDGQKEPTKRDGYGLLNFYYDEYSNIKKILDLAWSPDFHSNMGRYFPTVVLEYYKQNGIEPPWEK